MKTYIGTKIIKAEPETRDGKPGFRVVYPDGYTSWSPDHAFHGAYCKSGEMNFGHALEVLKQGGKVARSGWNGKGMFLFLVPGSTSKVNRAPLLGIYPEGTEINYHSHVDMKTADGQIVPWLCSQTDMLANDWCVID